MTSRYARHELISGWDQDRLCDARVVIAGVGALGSEVARLLAMAGVGSLVLCDHDLVDATNLSRGGLYRDADVGRPKVLAAAEALRDIAPDAEVVTRAFPLIHGLGLSELRDATLVVSCLDSRESRLQLMSRCALASTGMLDGGTSDWGGEVGWYERAGPCYGCGLSPAQRAEVDGALSCLGGRGPAGASGAVSALVGSLVAVFALRISMGQSLAHQIVRVDAATCEMAVVRSNVDPHCPLHERIDEEAVKATRLSNRAPLGDVIAILGRDEKLFSWASTPGGGLVMNDAPLNATLEQLGIAPGELLPVVGGDQTTYLELTTPDAVDREETR